jgi:hypothetical protein
MIFHSAIQPIYLLLPLIGLIIGLLGSMLGGGGGFFFLPILILLFHVPSQTAVITSLVATLPICIAGTFSHHQKNNINFHIAIQFVLSGIVGTIIGTKITSTINSDQLKIAFGIYSILIAVNIGYATWQKRGAETLEKGLGKSSGLSKITKGSFFGFIAGIITGTFGTSGTSPVLAGLFSMRLPFKKVIGTSLLIVLVNTIVAISAHFLINKIDFTLIIFLTAGSAIGALIGPRLLMKVKIDSNENKLRYWYAAVMLAIGLLIIID